MIVVILCLLYVVIVARSFVFVLCCVAQAQAQVVQIFLREDILHREDIHLPALRPPCVRSKMKVITIVDARLFGIGRLGRLAFPPA